MKGNENSREPSLEPSRVRSHGSLHEPGRGPQPVRLTILGRQYEIGYGEDAAAQGGSNDAGRHSEQQIGEQRTEQRVAAVLKEKQDEQSGELFWELRWKERVEEQEGLTFCTATIQPNLLILERKGAVNTRMEIREGAETTCLYTTAMGSLPMTIRTHRVAVRRSAAALIVRAEYDLLDWGFHSVVTLRAETRRLGMD